MAGPGQNAPTTLIVCYRLLGWLQFLFLLRVVFFLLRVVLFWRTRHYEPPYFNDCRWELPEELLPVAGGALPVAKKALPVAEEVGACARVSDGSHALGSEG